MSKTTSIIMVLMLVQTIFGQQHDLDTDEIIDIIIAAQKAELATYKQGLGSCSITTLSKTDVTDPINEKRNVKFYFKGMASRVDIETSGDSEKNSYSEVDTGEFWLRYNKLYDSAIVEQSRVKDVNEREFSKDFHPNVYYGYLGGITLPDLLEKARTRCDIKFHFTKDGLLELTSKYGYDVDGNAEPAATTSMYNILLDPAHSYRPLKWTYEQKNSVFKGDYQKVERTIEWPGSSDSCYPSSVIHSQTTIRSPERIKKMSAGSLRIPKSSTSEIHIEEISVTSNASVSDEVFTLEGMGVKKGIFIDDAITGISYEYGATQKIDEESLELLLDSTSSNLSTSGNMKPHACVPGTNTSDNAMQFDEPPIQSKMSRIMTFSLFGLAAALIVFLLGFLIGPIRFGVIGKTVRYYSRPYH